MSKYDVSMTLINILKNCDDIQMLGNSLLILANLSLNNNEFQ